MQNKDDTPNWLKQYHAELMHHGVKGQKWGVRNGPPYPIDRSGESSKMRISISEDKFVNYALNPAKDPNKARAFKDALGYTINNANELIRDIASHFDENELVERGDVGFGMRYQQIMRLKGPNNKEANVVTAWIQDEDGFRLTSVYITKKGVKK